MKQHLSTDLAEFTRTVEAIAASAQDFVTPTTAMRTFSNEDGTMLNLDGVRNDRPNQFPVNDHAHSQISAFCDIPKRYYDRMRNDAPALLDSNIDRWFQNPKRRLVRTLGGEVRAFLSDRYARIDNVDIMAAVNPVLRELAEQHPGIRAESAALTDKRMYLKVVVPTIQAELRSANRGDIVQAGFVISNSEVGAGKASVDQMIYRLLCKNGMIAGERFSRRHLGARIEDEDSDVFSDRTKRLDDRTVISAMQDMVRAACDVTRFQAVVAQMDEAIDTRPIESPRHAVEVLAKKHDLSENESDLVLGNLLRDVNQNGLGLFGLLNAVTAASQNVDEYERATELEALGGTLLDMDTDQWADQFAVHPASRS